MKTLTIHKNDVRVGDAILFNGDFKTVSNKDIKEGGFFGRTIFGDSFRNGFDLVTVLDIRRSNPLGAA
jgi:hypothetical protein